MSRLATVYRNAARGSVPIEVMFELTHHCNFRCRHCYIPDFGVRDGLSTERVVELLDEMAEMGTLVVALSGGEVLLRRDWAEIGRHARSLGFDLQIFTNGSLVDDQTASTLSDLHATAQVSLYAMEAEVFDGIVDRPGAFDEVVAGIQRLRAHDVRVVLKMPLMTLNRGQADGVRAFGTEIGAEVRLSPWITAKKDGDLAPLAHRLSHQEIVGELGGPTIGCHGDPDPEAPLCAAASRYCVITSTGDVMACNILPGSDANVRERSFRDVWETSEWLQRIRSVRAGDLSECGSCERLAYCARCQAQALVEDGDLLGPSRWAQERADLIDRLSATS